MDVTDCIWEKDNIGKKTVEITINKGDNINSINFEKYLKLYEYTVVKVPMCMVELNVMLGNLGFSLIEVQMNVSSKIKGYDWNRINLDIKDIRFDVLSDSEDIKKVLNQITDDMFSTDRITLDRNFGPKIGHNRYVNWIKNDFENHRSKVAVVNYRNEEVGFMMYRIKENIFHLLLNGLYKKWQGRHLGIITPASPLIYSLVKPEIKEVKTSISSNNIPVVKLYNRLGYILDDQNYVFVKHNWS